MSRTLGNGYISRVSEGVSFLGSAKNNISFWQFATNDTAAAVEAANFFNGMAKNLSVGDVILASMDLDGTAKFKIYMVTAISAAGVVTVALQTTTAG